MSDESKLHELPKMLNESTLLRSVFGMYESQCLNMAIQHKVFDIVKSNQPISMQEIIKKCGLGKRGGEVVINLITALGYLICLDGKYSLTDLSETYLISDTPFKWHHVAEFFYQPLEIFKKAWEKDLSIDAKKEDMNVSWEDESQMTVEFARKFTKLMEGHSAVRAISVAKRVNFNERFGVTSILDVGGGSGVYSRAIVANQPKINAIILDLPKVCDVCQEYINKSNLREGSAKVYPCDMFKQPFPDCNDSIYGYQAIFLSHILHDWEDDRNIVLLKKCYDALPSNGSIFLHEVLFNEDGNGPVTAALFSAHMFVFARGKQYKFSEFKDLLTHAGFKDIGRTLIDEPYFVVHARK